MTKRLVYPNLEFVQLLLQTVMPSQALLVQLFEVMPEVRHLGADACLHGLFQIHYLGLIVITDHLHKSIVLKHLIVSLVADHLLLLPFSV